MFRSVLIFSLAPPAFSFWVDMMCHPKPQKNPSIGAA